ncbi:MAG: DUF167 domain-containing protein [Coriobacteriales bacterium]|nr:DUF167 domain-containing protein [Coriobacteriales bacterium]
MSENDSVTLALKVIPRAGANAVVGWSSETRDELLVRVTAPPEGGKANAAVLKALAQSLGIPRTSMRIVRGVTSRQKLVAFEIGAQRYLQWKDSLLVRQP